MTDPLDQDAPCPHPDFDCMVAFARQTAGEGGPVVAFTMEVKVWCKQCTEAFHFLVPDVGMLADRPTVSPDGQELRVPMRPEWDPDFGLGVPGYTVALRPHGLEFVGWMCPCHRRVVRPDADGNKPEYHLISKDEGETRCNINPDLWVETWVRPHEEATGAT